MANIRTKMAAWDRRWLILATVAMTQLVVILDGTIVATALPQAQVHLGMSDVERQWVVTAYALTFGSLLLLGGRIADFWGRKRTYIVGLLGFGLASGYGGLVNSGAELIAGRALQGAFAALMAPAALAILTITFPAGFAMLTMTIAISATVPVGTRILNRVGPRPLLITGPAIAVVGLLYLSRITVAGGFFAQIMPALIIIGVGMACMFVPIQNLALLGVDAHDAGAAAAAGNASNQIGGSIALAVYTSIYEAVAGASHNPEDLVAGYRAVFVSAAITLALGIVIAAVMIRGTKEQLMPGAHTR